MNVIQLGRLLPASTPLKGERAVWNGLVNRRDERGQILLIVAAGLLLFVSLVGLVIDTGVGFRERRDLQNSSDLSAMAGTKVIADHYLDGGRTGAEVYAAIDASLTANGCVPADGCDWTAIYVRARPGRGWLRNSDGPLSRAAVPSRPGPRRAGPYQQHAGNLFHAGHRHRRD